MASSVLEAIETTGVSTIAGVTGVASVKPVPAGLMFGPLKDGDLQVTLPDVYPGAVLSVVEDEIEIADVRFVAGEVVVSYEVPLDVAVYATSPSGGAVAHDARHKAWEIAEAIETALKIVIPTGLPAGPITPWPFGPAKKEQILADATTHGVLLRFTVKYQFG